MWPDSLSGDLERPGAANLNYVGDTQLHECLVGALTREDISGASGTVERINALLPDGWPVGLEREIVVRQDSRLELEPTGLRNPLAQVIVLADTNQPCQLPHRPPSELAAYRLWQLLDAGQLEPLTLCEISRLAGGADAIRTVRATASRFLSGQAIEYLKPSLILGRLAPLLTRVQVRETELPPIAHALGVFFETLLIHPFADGNGRLARLLFQGSLHQTVKLRAPVFPLGPSLFANRNAAIRAYLAWEFDSSAVPLLRFVAAAVDSIDQFVTELALNHCKR